MKASDGGGASDDLGVQGCGLKEGDRSYKGDYPGPIGEFEFFAWGVHISYLLFIIPIRRHRVKGRAVYICHGVSDWLCCAWGGESMW